MTTETIESVEAKVAESTTTFDKANLAYRAEMAKGGEANDDEVERLILERKRARGAMESATAEVAKFKANESWQSLATSLRPVNRALEEMSKAGLPTAQPTGMSGDVSIAEDGAVTVNARITYAAVDLDALKASIRTRVETQRDAFKASGVKGFNFAVTKAESGEFVPSISPVGTAGVKKSISPVAGTGVGGTGSNAYVAPDGSVHTARECIEALRSTYGGQQKSIDNALDSNNGVRNIAIALCEKNGWTVTKR